ncbi:MAG TPA: VgrG-related protein [Acidimicrobiales bacterium]|nr:VgrG-related protein [Acidimicrobiales bacterium]
MPDVQQFAASTFSVEFDGNPLADDILSLMTYAVVEDNLNLPDSFSLWFLDPDRIVLTKTGAKPATKVKIKVRTEEDQAGQVLLDGEVTALEAEFEGGRTHTVVRGLDNSNRLYRGRRTMAYKNVTVADVVRKVARGAGLQPGRIERADGGTKRQVTQANLSDAEFLIRLAGEVGFVLEVEDGKVNFYKPPTSSGAPSTGRMAGPSTNPLQLTHGDNLLRYSATITSDSQVKDVAVRGWDVKKKQAVLGAAPVKTNSAVVGLTPARLAGAFNSKEYVATEVPYGNSAEVQAAANALAEQVAGAHAQLEGVARGNPKLRAGQAVSLGQVGTPFEGKYTLTATRHVFDNGEYLTHFSSTGRQDRSLQSLTSAGGGGQGASAAFVPAPVLGVVVGIVTNVNDTEDKIAQVKVKFPWLDDTLESDWLRVVQAGAGKEYGMLVLPEVNDEVLVAFEHGDMRRGYVLGGLYNGLDKPNNKAYTGILETGNKIAKRSFTSRMGHFLLISDKASDQFVQVSTVDEKFFLKLDKTNQVILVTSDKEIKVDAKGDITITGAQNVTVEAKRDLVLKGMNVTVQATQKATVKGAQVAIEGSSTTDVKGATTKVAGTGTLNLESSGIAVLKGSLVKIN